MAVHFIYFEKHTSYLALSSSTSAVHYIWSLSLSLSLGSKTLNPNLISFSLVEAWIGNWELGDGVGGEVGWGNWELLRIAPSSSCPKSRLLFCSAPHSRASLSHRPPLVRLLVRRHLHFLPLRNWGTTHFLSLQLNFASFFPFCAHKLSLKNNTIPSCLLSLFRILWIECCIHYLILVHKWVSIKNRKLSYWNWTQGFIYIYMVWFWLVRDTCWNVFAQKARTRVGHSDTSNLWKMITWHGGCRRRARHPIFKIRVSYKYSFVQLNPSQNYILCHFLNWHIF